MIEIMQPGARQGFHQESTGITDDMFKADLVGEIPALRAYARSLTKDAITADDLVQESLLRAMEKNHLWRRGTNLRAWAFTILHNLFVNRCRKNQSRPTHVSIEDLSEHRLPRLYDHGERTSLKHIETAINLLPARQREAIILIAVEGFSYAEVASITGVPVGTVRSRLSRARVTLRAILDGHGQGDGPPPALAVQGC